MATRYPRTPHLPWSEGATPDDVRAASAACFEGRDVVVTEKLDGENTTLYRDDLHARSPTMAPHPSRTWIKAYHDRIRLQIPEGFMVCGEGMFAKHALHYGVVGAPLESWFYLFSVWGRDDRCLDWDATVAFGMRIGAPTPRVLYRGRFDEKRIRALNIDRARVEGYVVRTVDGFARPDFAARLAKYVRKDHVVADQHWAHGPVTPNLLGPKAIFWDVRAGLRCSASGLAQASGLALSRGAERRADVAQARLDALGRRGDARLEGALAACFADARRADLVPALAPTLGMRVARRVADLVALARAPREPFPDPDRSRGLRSLSRAVDLGALHAVAAATTTSEVEAELVAWSELHAADAGLLDHAPLDALRRDARRALQEIPPRRAQRAWSAIVERWVDGRVRGIDDALAATFAEQREDRASLVVMCGPSGSGKSTLARRAFDDHVVVSLDEARAARSHREDQSGNRAILGAALAELGAHLSRGRQVVWDATSLVRAQRSLVLAAASRCGALSSIALLHRSAADLERTNRSRDAKIPAEVLELQRARFVPPFPFEADRILYAGATGTIEDTAGDLLRDEPELLP